MKSAVASLGVVLFGWLAPPAQASELSRKVDRLRSLVAEAPEPSRSVAGCSQPVAFDARASEDLDRAVRDASIRYGVSPQLIHAVIEVESAANPAALSHAGAMGLMQLMPGTARELGVVCPYGIRENVLGGTRYLRRLRDDFGSWRRALAAYNAGPTRVREDRIPAETRRYVADVMEAWAER